MTDLLLGALRLEMRPISTYLLLLCLKCLSNISFDKINMFSYPFTYHPVKSKLTLLCIRAEHHMPGTVTVPYVH